MESSALGGPNSVGRVVPAPRFAVRRSIAAAAIKTPGLEVNWADQPTKNETTIITDSELPTARWWTVPGFGDLGPVKVPQLRGDTAAGFSHGFSMVQRLCTSAFKN